MTPTRAMAYVAFALCSMAVNIGVQHIVALALAGRTAGVLPVSMVFGTAAGFALKYGLDKRFIFDDRSATYRDETRKLAFYGLFGILTTAIFWVVEIGAAMVFGTTGAQYGGAVVGLTLGYGVKFGLDRRYTFTGAAGGLDAPVARQAASDPPAS